MGVMTTVKELECTELSFGGERVRYLFGYSCERALAYALLDGIEGREMVLLVTDDAALQHEQRLEAALSGGPRIVRIVVRSAERRKRLSLVADLLEQAVAKGVTRDCAVIALGGGVVGNLAGMAAALLYRGLPLIHLPTTAVAAFDSVLSAKQAVNLAQGKNLCGTFLTPSLIACDLAWLRTVPREQLMTGIVEMAKNVLAVRPEDGDRFLAALPIIESSPESAFRTFLKIGIDAKAPFLAVDPKERRVALAFEYGHTVGHALEFASGHTMSHGEAVGWGMLAAADVSRQISGLSGQAVHRHHELIAALGISRKRLSAIDPEAVKGFVAVDNKRGYLSQGRNSVPMVLLSALGCPVAQDGRPLVAVDPQVVGGAVDRLLRG